jgi:hypothetical protein
MELDRHRFDRHVASSESFYPHDCPRAPSRLHAECLIGGPDPHVEVHVRFAQTVERMVLDRDEEPVEQLLVTGRRHRAGAESVEHEVRIAVLPGRAAVVRAAGSERAELTQAGARAGTLLWLWEPLHATVEAWIDLVRPRLHRVRVDFANRLEAGGVDEERAWRRTLHSPRLTVHSADGAFASPVELEPLTAA